MGSLSSKVENKVDIKQEQNKIDIKQEIEESEAFKQDKFRIELEYALGGSVISQDSVGYCYYNGTGVKQDYKKAAEWFEKASKNGSLYGEVNLGVCYYKGEGVDQDLNKAYQHFLKAAFVGFKDAQKIITLILEDNKNRIYELENKIKELETEIKYRPGGSGFKECEKEFEMLKDKL